MPNIAKAVPSFSTMRIKRGSFRACLVSVHGLMEVLGPIPAGLISLAICPPRLCLWRNAPRPQKWHTSRNRGLWTRRPSPRMVILLKILARLDTTNGS